MKKNKSTIASTVFQKFIMAITGLLLLGFVITHLLGNLTLYSSDASLFNEYTHKLESLGPLLWVAEIGLVLLFAFHIVMGIKLTLKARSAKPIKYENARSKAKSGDCDNPNSVYSRNMAITGSVLMIFLVAHVIHFKFGPNITEGYVAMSKAGEEIRDLHRHVNEQFKNPVIMSLYVAVMLFLGSHLRHGFWSAFQSLGLTRENTRSKLMMLGIALAILLSVGFLFIPIVMFFRT